MKYFINIIILFVSVSANSQSLGSAFAGSGTNPTEGGIITAFYTAEPSNSDLYKNGTFALMKRNKQYIFVYRIYSKEKINISPYLKCDSICFSCHNGKRYTLYQNSDLLYSQYPYPIASAGLTMNIGYQANTPPPVKYYITELFYDIPDITEFVSQNYTGYAIAGNTKLVDMSGDNNKFSEKFHKRLQNALKSVDRLYQRAEKHKTDGTWVGGY